MRILETAILARIFETGDVAYVVTGVTCLGNLLARTLGDRVLHDVVISGQLRVVMSCVLLLSDEIANLDLIGSLVIILLHSLEFSL